MTAVPKTPSRVTQHTDEEIDRRIRRQTEASVAYFAEHLDEIDDRLRELDREWDVERALEANSSALSFTGILLGTIFSRRFLILPAFATVFLIQHALRGWSPPMPVLRRLGLRTAQEIEEERIALKQLRGDFVEDKKTGASAYERARRVLEAVRRRADG